METTVNTTAQATDTHPFRNYVQFFNAVNGTSYSIEEALSNAALIAAYHASKDLVNTKVQKSSKKNTKKSSYDAFIAENAQSVDFVVYKYLKTTGLALSRAMIATTLNMRVSTVCGVVSRLKDQGMIAVSGSVVDQSSNREVETLSAIL